MSVSGIYLLWKHSTCGLTANQVNKTVRIHILLVPVKTSAILFLILLLLLITWTTRQKKFKELSCNKKLSTHTVLLTFFCYSSNWGSCFSYLMDIPFQVFLSSLSVIRRKKKSKTNILRGSVTTINYKPELVPTAHPRHPTSVFSRQSHLHQFLTVPIPLGITSSPFKTAHGVMPNHRQIWFWGPIFSISIIWIVLSHQLELAGKMTDALFHPSAESLAHQRTAELLDPLTS